MLSAMKLLVGLAVLSSALASPVEFVSMSYTTPAPLPISTPTGIASSKSEALIVERTATTRVASGSTAPGWTFISCFTDDIDARALLTQVYINAGSEAMSVSQCNYRCWVEGYILSGVEFAHECWCDHALNGEYHVMVQESECNMVCAGNDMETCGGANRIAIYKYSNTPALETGKPILSAPTLTKRSVNFTSYYIPIGCYEDSKTLRMLRNYIVSPGADQDMTVEMCTTACYDSGFPYSGLEYGQECFCDTLMQTLVKAPETECNLACPGDSGELCGGDLRINVYSYHGPMPITASSTTASPTITTSSMTTQTNLPITVPGAHELLGCYSDTASNRTLGIVGSFPGSAEAMTLEPCQDACQHAGYVFAGVEFGSECWCDSAIRGIVDAQVPDAECNMPCSGNASEICGGSNRINVYSFATATSTFTTHTMVSSVVAGSTTLPPHPNPYFVSIGCYTDSRSNRTLGIVGDFPGAHSNMAVKPCKEACQYARYVFVGVEFGNECWCGNVIQGIGTQVPDTDCNTPCSGNSSEICGGRDRINVYQLILAPTTSAPSPTSATSTSAMPAFTTSKSICTEYYKVAQDDYCSDIWTSFRISQEQFASWNPTLVFPKCQIFVGQSVCVHHGIVGSPVLTITGLPPVTKPTNEMPATVSVPTTVEMHGSSMPVTPTTKSKVAGPATGVSASTVPCSVFYQVAEGDYCYEIWTSFAILQDQFTEWNPSLLFPQCQIFPGDLVCVRTGSGSATTVTALPAAATPTSSDNFSSTSTVTATRTSTVVVMTRVMSKSNTLTVSPFIDTAGVTSTSTSSTSETTSLRHSSQLEY